MLSIRRKGANDTGESKEVKGVFLEKVRDI